MQLRYPFFNLNLKFLNKKKTGKPQRIDGSFKLIKYSYLLVATKQNKESAT